MVKSYSKFTAKDLAKLDIKIIKKAFLGNPKAIVPSDWLTKTLEINLRLPLSSEKAKCELIITPILGEMIERNQYAFTYFSGYNFDVDKSLGLHGRCDYLLSLEPNSFSISAPIFSIVEAKNDNLDVGVPQCVAEMYAAQLYNGQQNRSIKTIYGAVSFGLAWQFLQMEGKTAWLDPTIFYINDLPKIIGVLQSLIDLALKQK
ncbi:MAG: hypothetical protein MUE30_19630 [Spirosomaceae bacterium]|jgi:hypothetical protein|nr:hypothetical protein [Spirosomataceae bacterium]